MSVKYKVMASTGTYTDASGQEKKRWMQCGVVLVGKTGNLSLKMEAIPVGSEWNGWFSLFEPENDKPKPRERQAADFGDDDIPDF